MRWACQREQARCWAWKLLAGLRDTARAAESEGGSRWGTGETAGDLVTKGMGNPAGLQISFRECVGPQAGLSLGSDLVPGKLTRKVILSESVDGHRLASWTPVRCLPREIPTYREKKGASTGPGDGVLLWSRLKQILQAGSSSQ